MVFTFHVLYGGRFGLTGFGSEGRPTAAPTGGVCDMACLLSQLNTSNQGIT